MGPPPRGGGGEHWQLPKQIMVPPGQGSKVKISLRSLSVVNNTVKPRYNELIQTQQKVHYIQVFVKSRCHILNIYFWFTYKFRPQKSSLYLSASVLPCIPKEVYYIPQCPCFALSTWGNGSPRIDTWAMSTGMATKASLVGNI